MTPEHRIYALWDAWAISWTVAMFWSNRILKRDGRGAELFFRVSFCASFILLFGFPPSRHYYAQTPLWQFPDAMLWILVALTAPGLLFTWWARIHLGPLWSSWAVKKADHPHRRHRALQVRAPSNLFGTPCRAGDRDPERNLIRAARHRRCDLGLLRQSATGRTLSSHRTRRRCL